MVGPNGSGKSNVIDAMLFVFGKRAKQLRLSKVSELIHNSTHHRNLEQARVSVHFQEIVDLVSAQGWWWVGGGNRACTAQAGRQAGGPSEAAAGVSAAHPQTRARNSGVARPPPPPRSGRRAL